MRIGIVSTWFERGAAYVSRAYEQVLEANSSVFIYARGGESYARTDPRWARSNVTWGPRLRTGIPHFVVWEHFRRWVKDNRLDVVIFNEQRSWDVVLRSAQLDIVIGAYVDFYTSACRPLFHLYDFLLCNTLRHRSAFVDHPHAIYVPWGTDCETFNGTCDPVARSTTVFFHSCGVSPWRKGTDLLLHAFKEVVGDVQLVVHSQGGLRSRELQRLIRQDGRVRLIEESVGAPGLYHLGDVYVYPTRRDGIGLSLVEALACGLPAIVPACSPMDEFVREGVNGRLVSVEKWVANKDRYLWPDGVCSIEELVKAMQYYVDWRRDLGGLKRLAREDAVRRLNWRRNAAGLDRAIGAVQRRRRPLRLLLAAAAHEYPQYPAYFVRGLKKMLVREGRDQQVSEG